VQRVLPLDDQEIVHHPAVVHQRLRAHAGERDPLAIIAREWRASLQFTSGAFAAVKDLGVPVPIVIRMEGTNVEKGKQMLKESGLNFTTADTMRDGAERVVALAK